MRGDFQPARLKMMQNNEDSPNSGADGPCERAFPLCAASRYPQDQSVAVILDSNRNRASVREDCADSAQVPHAKEKRLIVSRGTEILRRVRIHH